jgi:hypothetical protein
MDHVWRALGWGPGPGEFHDLSLLSTFQFLASTGANSTTFICCPVAAMNDVVVKLELPSICCFRPPSRHCEAVANQARNITALKARISLEDLDPQQLILLDATVKPRMFMYTTS